MMLEYVKDHYDADDLNKYLRILCEAEQKQEDINQHLVYTQYKTSNNLVQARKIIKPKTANYLHYNETSIFA